MNTKFVEEKLKTFKKFLKNLKADQLVQIICHTDADGLTSAVIFEKTLKLLKYSSLDIIYPTKGDYAFSQSTKSRLAEINPASLVVLDLGVKDEVILKGAPTLFIDHHHPFGVPPQAFCISSYLDKDLKPTSFLTYELCSSIVDIKDLAWVAAIGTVGDLGVEGSAHLLEKLGDLNKHDIREAQVLINSAKRSSNYDIDTALKTLKAAKDAGDIAHLKISEAGRLQKYREEVNQQWRKCRHIAPRFKWKVALISFSSPCGIQGLLAEMWKNQLKDYIVVCANFGYLEKKVAFVAKTLTNINVVNFMEAVKPEGIKEPMVFGHDKAAGNVVNLYLWKRLAERMGFK